MQNQKTYKLVLHYIFMDYHKFFGRKVDIVAKDLLGRSILRITNKGNTAAKIIETGAYEEGETPSREGMKYAPGTIFLMPYRSTYLFNIATDKRGYPSCVEIREIALHDKIISGSGKVSKFFDIGPDLDGIVLGEEIKIIGENVDKSKIKKIKGKSDNCIGYFLIK